MSSRSNRLEGLAIEAVEAARQALGFGLDTKVLGLDSKKVIGELAGTLINYEAKRIQALGRED